MTLRQLFDMLDMDDAGDLQYYEQLADLLELDEPLEFDLFYSVLSNVDADTMAELIGNYMDELSDALPDDTEDIFTLVETIKQKLLFLTEGLDEADNRRSFAEELFKFRRWYVDPKGAIVDDRPCSVRDAVTSHRADKLQGDTHVYDFSQSLSYEQDSISMSLGAFERIDIVDELPDEDEGAEN